MSGSDFLPQAISFSASPQAAAPPPVDFGPAHAALGARLADLPPGSPWRGQLALELRCLESELRGKWVSSVLVELHQAFAALIEAAEDPARWLRPETDAVRQQLLAGLEALRGRLQSELLPLMPAALAPLQRFVTAQLTKLDALRLGNASAYEKSREAADAARGRLSEARVMPGELLLLAELDRLLDTAVRYQFAWDVARAAKAEREHHLTALQQIALTGLRSPRLPEAPRAEGHDWHWQANQLRSDLGLGLRSLRAGADDWLKRGLRCLQQAVRQGFASPEPLREALECFYAAHAAARGRAEPLVAIAWMLTLLGRPVEAVDALELALRREPLPEIKELFWLIQALDPANQPKRLAKRV